MLCIFLKLSLLIEQLFKLLSLQLVTTVHPACPRFTTRWQCWGDEASVAEHQRPLSQTHDHPGCSLPLPRGGGKDGHPTEGVQGGEESGSLPGQIQTGALQEWQRTRQPQTLHWLYNWCKFLPPSVNAKKLDVISVILRKMAGEIYSSTLSRTIHTLIWAMSSPTVYIRREGLFISLYCVMCQWP